MSSSGSTPSFTPSRTPPPDLSTPDEDDNEDVTAARAVPRAAEREDNLELQAFRKQWQQEVLRRRRAGQPEPTAGPSEAGLSEPPLGTIGTTRSQPPASTSSHRRSAAEREGGALQYHDREAEVDPEEVVPHEPGKARQFLARAEVEERQSGDAGGAPRKREHLSAQAPAHANVGTAKQMRAAVQAYALAVENERKGNLDEALVNYRKAFRLDSSADRLYERAFSLLTASGSAVASESKGNRVAVQQQQDALLASQEVADMVRRATDFEDYRANAIESARQAGQAAASGQAASQEELRQDKVTSEQASMSIPLSSEQDELEALIRRVSSNEAGEGRSLESVTFTSPPPAVSRGGQQSDVQQKRMSQEGSSKDVQAVTEALDATKLDASEEEGSEQESGPPPLIAMLPDEILTHICHWVIQPRGRRGAKIRPPKVELPTAASSKNGRMTKAGDAVPAQATFTTGSAEHEASEEATPSSTSRRPKAPLGVGTVLGGPDWQSLEMLGRTCWKWRLTSRAKGLWRLVLDETYQDPQLPLPRPAPSIDNPRLTFIHHPRLRLTGCYIAACHYSRPGLSVDNAWVRVIHLVEFYRSIRFLPDGRALTLLTTEVPKETVGKMHAANGDHGFAVGRWRVEWPPQRRGSVDDSDDGNVGGDGDGLGAGATAKKRERPGGARVVIEDLQDRSRPKYSFQMVLSLRSTSRGKWNKMEMIDYRSVHLETGEVVSIPQKHGRPFHFSAVRSYGI